MRASLLRASARSALALVVACGSRTGLDPGGAPAPEQGDASAFPDAALAPSDASIAPLDAAVVPNGCTSALEPGSPAPLAGYCSTQAFLAPTRAPSHPAVVWSVQLDANASPSEMVVDAAGRTYVASCSAPQGGGWVDCKKLVALGPDGAVLWTHAFDSGVGELFLDPAGVLHAAWGSPRTLVTFDASGAMTTRGTLPPDVSYRLVGRDGSLYGAKITYTGSDVDALVKITPEGRIVWSTPLPCHACVDSMALGADDALVASLTASADGGLGGLLVRVDASGTRLWQKELPGFAAEHIAIAADGSVRVALWEGYQTAASTLALASVGPRGDLAWRTDLHQDPEQTSLYPLVVMKDGATIFRSFTHLDAVDARGNVLWSKRLSCPNCAYTAAGDPFGGVVVVTEDLERIDPATGAVAWKGIAPPMGGGVTYFGGPFVLGPPGVLIGTGSGGVVFAAKDP